MGPRTQEWDPKVGSYGGTLRWDSKVGPQGGMFLSIEKKLSYIQPIRMFFVGLTYASESFLIKLQVQYMYIH